MGNLFTNSIQRLEKIAKIIDLREDELNLLTNHRNIAHEILDVNGEKYPAWRIVHNNALGPGKGGIRFHPNVNEDEVKSLSFWMSIKNSLAGLPFGGAKGGIQFNPKDKTKREIELISRAYIKSFFGELGANKDIAAPDVYTNSEVMGWMLDEYEKIMECHEPAMITGKPIELGGISLRNSATAQGGVFIIEELVKSFSLDKNLKVAIQGFGNAGSIMADILSKSGYLVVAVSDSKTGVYNEKGLDIDKLKKYKKDNGSLLNYNHDNSKLISNNELLELDVDVLVLAALENQITNQNANNIKTKFIVELANGPVDNEADNVLFKNGVTIVPDILANAGGVVVSYFEWAQNLNGNLFDDKYLAEKFETIMRSNWRKVYDTFIKNNKEYDLRTNAYIIAIERIIKAEKSRGNL